MARDWEKYEAELREEIERKVAHAMERVKRTGERAAARAEWHAERAARQAERQADRVKERFERAGERRERRSNWTQASVFGIHVPGPTGGSCKTNRDAEIFFGLLILAVGAALLLANLGVFSFHDFLGFWPVALIVWGLLRIGRARFVSAYAFGIFVTIAGVIFLLGSLHLVHVSWNLFWPAILILVGIQHLARNFDPPKAAPAQSEATPDGTSPKAGSAGPGPETPTSGPRSYNENPSDAAASDRPAGGWTPSSSKPGSGWTSGSGWASAPTPPPQPASEVPPFEPPPPAAGFGPDVYLHEYCIFTGSKRRIETANFRGGELVAVFGGIDIDLRNCQIAGAEAVVDITAAFGGCTMRVPQSWYVEMRGVAAFGGYTNKTIPPRGGPGQRIQKLVVTGSAAFGGVMIEN